MTLAMSRCEAAAGTRCRASPVARYAPEAACFSLNRLATLGADATSFEEVHKIAGEDCLLVKIRAPVTEELGDILDGQINIILTVAGVRTTIVLKWLLEGPPLGGMRPNAK